MKNLTSEIHKEFIVISCQEITIRNFKNASCFEIMQICDILLYKRIKIVSGGENSDKTKNREIKACKKKP